MTAKTIPVFSTYVEVIPTFPFSTLTSFSILHVCGGDPYRVAALHAMQKVFSTYVEVILTILFLIGKVQGILHVCGGDPNSATPPI